MSYNIKKKELSYLSSDTKKTFQVEFISIKEVNNE